MILFIVTLKDPEDEDLPPKPALFIESIFSGSKMATSKADENAKDGDHKPVCNN